MTEIHLQGKICIENQPREFISDFTSFLKRYNAVFQGKINVIEFTDVEIIEETSEQ